MDHYHILGHLGIYTVEKIASTCLDVVLFCFLETCTNILAMPGINSSKSGKYHWHVCSDVLVALIVLADDLVAACNYYLRISDMSGNL